METLDALYRDWQIAAELKYKAVALRDSISRSDPAWLEANEYVQGLDAMALNAWTKYQQAWHKAQVN